MKKMQPDILIKNIAIVDVFNQCTYVDDVVIKDGYFAGVGSYDVAATTTIDGSGKTIIPGLIDGHVHIESSMITPIAFSNAVLPFGVTAIIADPHEIANVAGTKGIEFMLNAAKSAPLDTFIMLPSCVPATDLEDGAYTLKATDLKRLYRYEYTNGLAEVMDFPAVLSCDDDMLQKISDALNNGYVVDGHCSNFSDEMLNAYACAGIRTDHEAISEEELFERNKRGIHTLIRSGSVCKDLPNLIGAINDKNSRLLCLATDDKHLDDLVNTGGIYAGVTEAISLDIDPITAITLASYNTANCYNLKNRGAIAPGYIADFSIVDDLNSLNIIDVYKNGNQVVADGRLISPVSNDQIQISDSMIHSINMLPVNRDSLKIDMKGNDHAHIIGVQFGGVVTKKLIERVSVDSDGNFTADTEKDQLKIAVIERHKREDSIGLGIIKGLDITKGAIATTIAHDSHNIIAVGTNDTDMLLAINTLKEINGGIVIVNDNKVLARLSLEICGLISARETDEILKDLADLYDKLQIIAPDITVNPFLTLSFMSLIVIPEIKVCKKGLFDYSTFDFIDVYVDSKA